MRRVKYDDVRDGIKSGDRFEFAGKSIVGRLIRWFTKEDVSHTALAISIDEYSIYPGNRKFLLEAESSGIVLNTARHDIEIYTGRIFYTPLLPMFDSKRHMIADWALQVVGAGYDFGSLFANALVSVNANMRRLFCSEYYFIALVAAGIIPGCELKNCAVQDLDGKPVKAPRPGEFDRYPIFGDTVEIIK